MARWLPLLLLVACSTSPSGSPRPERVEPSAAAFGEATSVRIIGAAFRAEAKASFRTGNLAVDTTFRVWLGDTELEDVTYVSREELTATIPASLDIGRYDLVVLTPQGKRGTLADAFEVAECLEDDDCDDADPCTGTESCAARVCAAGEPLVCPAGDDKCTVPACVAGVGCDVVPNPIIGTACDGDDSDACADDVIMCDAGDFWCSHGADTLEGPVGDATCIDGLDNDCDGDPDGADLDCTTLVDVTSEAELIAALTAAATTPGPDRITVSPGSTVALTAPLDLLGNSDGITLIGDGATLDGSGIGSTSACLMLDGPNLHIAGFEITGCPSYAISVLAGTSGSQVERCNIHDNARGVFWSSPGNRFGPDNEVAYQTGANISGMEINEGVEIFGNRIHHNGGYGIYLVRAHMDPCLIWDNLIDANGDTGIFVAANVDGTRMLFNTVTSNGHDGIALSSEVDATDIDSNAVTFNAGWGISNTNNNRRLALFDFNAYFGNASGACSDCTSVGLHDLFVDPLYVDSANSDYALAPGSPLIDAGDATLGLDVNGTTPGAYNGLAPDIGALESD